MKNNRLLQYSPYILSTLTLMVVLYVRIRLLSVPLERDEGEYAYMGQLLLKGIPPFTYAYTMKLPGVSIMYALVMLMFGQTSTGIHLGLLLVNTICIVLIYLLTKRLFDRSAALLSCASYAVLSVSSSVAGYFTHATHFVVLFVLAGFLLLLRSIDKKQNMLFILSGLCLGIAITMKQHAVLFFVYAIMYLLWHIWKEQYADKRTRKLSVVFFLLGAVIPYVLIVLWMAETGSFTNFWFWTVQYAREYASSQTLKSGWEDFKGSFSVIAKSQASLWCIAGYGFILTAIRKRDCTDIFFVVGFTIFSFLAVCPGLFFRNHYFILFLPVVAMMIGVASSTTKLSACPDTSKVLSPYIHMLLFVIAVAICLYHEKDEFFSLTPLEVSRATNGLNPFPESVQIADYIKNNSTSDDRIAVLGSEPQILFYANRISATGHIYMYGLMEDQPYAERMQAQMISEVQIARPKYIIFVNVDVSWLRQESSVNLLLNWADSYLGYFYDPVGVIDIIPNSTKYIWDANVARTYRPVSDYNVTVFKRKSGV